LELFGLIFGCDYQLMFCVGSPRIQNCDKSLWARGFAAGDTRVPANLGKVHGNPCGRFIGFAGSLVSHIGRCVGSNPTQVAFKNDGIY